MTVWILVLVLCVDGQVYCTVTRDPRTFDNEQACLTAKAAAEYAGELEGHLRESINYYACRVKES